MQHGARQERTAAATHRKGDAARLSVVSNTTLVAMKLAAGAISGSVSIIAEALHSGLDLVAAMIAWFSVRAADLPPDDKHPYGHGKLENVSGTIEAALILVTAVWIGREAWGRLVHPLPVRASALGLSAMAISAGVNVLVSRRLFRVAKAENSIALEADAHHLSVDVYTSVGVFVGLLLIQITGWHVLDGVIAMLLALAIGHIAWDLTHRAAQPLLDTRLPEAEETSLVALIQEDPRVVDCHAVRSRTAGGQAFLDAHVSVSPGTTLEDADILEEDLRARLQRENPRLDVMLHVEPAARGGGP
ncbi:MAG: cation transporter [Armatimonadetes bacterium]|nr:cation transporter [Armatimonadota bacterium]